MKVTKRDGTKEGVNLNKISKRIETIARERNLSTRYVDTDVIAQKTVAGMYNNIQTSEIDTLAAETAAGMATHHPDYLKLAAGIEVSNMHKNTNPSYYERLSSLVEAKIVRPDILEKAVRFNITADGHNNEDYRFNYFGLRTLMKSYLLRIDGNIVERPQDLYIRVALELSDSEQEAKETYMLLRQHYYTHATPTLFNAGTNKNQLASCFLLDTEDSIKGIYKTLSDCADISKMAGGIGFNVNKVRSKYSPIQGTGGKSNGITPMLRVFNETARYVDQCFHGDTYVYTSKGPVMFKHLSESDKVLTLDGYRDIERVLRHNSKGSGFEISTKQSLRPSHVTDGHPFYTLRGQKKGINNSVIKNRLDKGLLNPEWIEASELVEGDFIGYPIPSEEKDMYFSEEDCWLYGLLVGDGSMPSDTSNAFTVHVNKNEEEILRRLRSYCEDRLIEFSEEVDGGRVRFRTQHSNRMPWSKNYLYSQDKQKFIHESLQLLPKDKTFAVIKGLMDSDGHYGSKELLLEMTSYQVVESVRFMLMRFGILSSGYERDRTESEVGIGHGKPTVVIRLPKVKVLCDYLGVDCGKYVNYLVHDNVMWSRITSIEKKAVRSVMFDLHVKGEHNYVTHSGLAHNGGGKRKGSFAAYIEPWHADVFDFLELKRPHGKEENKARDLFLGLWMNNLFFERVKNDSYWTLFSPSEAPQLGDVYGNEFESMYIALENKGLGRKIRAQELWSAIISSQIESGVPYLLNKDEANEKSNQKNLGTIRNSNLCTEIIQYSSEDEHAVCNLASIALPKFINGTEFDFEALGYVVAVATRNLNKAIDKTMYPTREARKSNMSHRPIGLGVQGLADVFFEMNIAFDSPEAKDLNKKIFEHIYFHALKESNRMARNHTTYASYHGSPVSHGILQQDMWNDTDHMTGDLSHEWLHLREDIRQYGVINSLLVAPMPTASTASILGNTEAFEPITSNLYVRRVLAGEFIMINEYLVKRLIKEGLWSESMRRSLINSNGSVQNLSVPQSIKDVYKTAYELSQKVIIDLAADRAVYIDQSQSMNLFLRNPNGKKLSSMYFYAWSKGLKTMQYYLRSSSAVDAKHRSTLKKASCH